MQIIFVDFTLIFVFLLEREGERDQREWREREVCTLRERERCVLLSCKILTYNSTYVWRRDENGRNRYYNTEMKALGSRFSRIYEIDKIKYGEK